MYEDASRTQEAVKLATELLASGYVPQNPRDFSWLIDFYSQKGDKEQAIKFAEQALSGAPASADLAFKLYGIYLKFGQTKLAQEFLDYYKTNQAQSWPDLESLINPEATTTPK